MSRRESSRRSTSAKGSNLRRDIQGLRALAVVVVVLDHLVEWPSGGFVGVDVFFVISGFLITGLLLREHDATGSISFSSFYRRRIRRIVPAATVVLVTTVAASGLLLNAGRTQQTFWDAVWSLLFVGNWRFAASGADYFQAAGPVSPLQHFWSLGVEEQFYFVWPVLMLLTFFFVGRRADGTLRQAHRTLGIVLATTVVASFIWASWETVAAPSWAYFSTFSRAWELGIGALLAVSLPVLQRIPDALRPLLAWAGLAGIVTALFVIDDGSAFPAPWGLLPVLATSLVIAGGSGQAQPHISPLTNPVSVYLGEISYSLYLWHFPVIVFLEALLPGRNATFFIVASASMLFLAVMSFELVESPIRRSRWLEPRASRTRARARRVHGATDRAKVFGVIGALVVTSALVGVALAGTAPAPSPSVASLADYTDEPQPGTPFSAHDSEIVNSANLAEWPVLSPSIAELATSQVSEWRVDGCLDVDETNIDDCVYGSGSKLAVLLGDSVAISYLPGIRAALEGSGWRIQSLTKTQCPAIFIPVRQSPEAAGLDTSCNEHHLWVQEKLTQMQPELVIVSSAEDSLRRLDSERRDEAAAADWEQATDASLALISATTPKTVLLAPPPLGEPISECATQLNGPSDCNTGIRPGLRSMMQEAEVAGAGRSNRSGHEVVHVGTTSWFCTSRGVCPPIIGTTPIRADRNHLTAAFAVKLAEHVREALL